MSKKKATAISLPMSRTAKIMNSAVGVESVNQDIVALATKATELFLTDFARRAYDMTTSNVLDYDDIQELVHSDPRYDFLVDTTPKRMKFSDALELVEKHDREQPPPFVPVTKPKQKKKPKPNSDAKEQSPSITPTSKPKKAELEESADPSEEATHDPEVSLEDDPAGGDQAPGDDSSFDKLDGVATADLDGDIES